MKMSRSKIEKLAKEINIIASVKPSHRIDIESWQDAGSLIRAINRLADRNQTAGNGLDRRLPLGGAQGEEENSMLAAFISEMPEGVLICNAEGQILLFNRRARQYLSMSRGHRGPPSARRIALGRSITSVMDKNLIEHALEEINARLNRNVVNAVSHFVFEGRGKHIIRAQVAPILDASGQFSGFILTLNDITNERESDLRVDALLQTLTKSARSPLASIRAANEAMLEYPDMDEKRLQQFKEIIYKESIVLSDILNTIADDYSSLKKNKRSLASIAGADLVATVRAKARDRLGIVVHAETSPEKFRIKADKYTLLMAILYVLNQLKDETGQWEFDCKLISDQEFVMLDFQWPGHPVKGETVRKWEDQYLAVGDEKSPLTLKEVLSHHEAAVWPHAGEGHEEPSACLRLLLPVDEPTVPQGVRPITILPDSHSDFLNLDLLNESDRNPDLDSRLLTELGYTVLIREVTEAKQVEDIVRKYEKLSALIYSMVTGGAKVRNLTRLITSFADAVLQQVIGIAIREMGPPPVPFAFMVLGSEGRKEQTLKTDQDNAIIYQDITPDSGTPEKAVQPYFLQLGEKICTWLDQIGYDFCVGEVMAKNPKWCKPLSTWKKYFSDWIRTVEPEDLLHASIFFDFSFAYGDPELVESLSRHMFDTLADNSGFFRHLAGNTLTAKPPIGFFGNFIVESKGEHRHQLDIKLAMLPIVDFARIFALRNGIKETNTQERLYHLYLKEIVSQEDFNEIEQAYDFMMQIRFAGQIKAIMEENAKPHNYINPKNLSTIEQKMLKEILKRVAKVQTKLSLEFPGAQESH